MRHKINKRIFTKETMYFTCYSTKCELTHDIDCMFIECGINLFGYNKSTDTYWGKKMDRKNCNLYFTVNVEQLNSNGSSINICIFHGDRQIVNHFYEEFYSKIKELDE